MKDFTIFFFLFSNTNFYYDRFIIKRFHQNHVFEEHIKWRKNKHLNSKHVNRKITLRVNLFKSTKHYGPYKSVHHSFISFLIDHQKSSKNYNMLFYFESDIKNKNGCVFNFKPTTRINNEYSDCDARCHQGPRTKERKKTWSPQPEKRCLLHTSSFVYWYWFVENWSLFPAVMGNVWYWAAFVRGVFGKVAVWCVNTVGLPQHLAPEGSCSARYVN